jgi:hypothetical protein
MVGRLSLTLIPRKTVEDASFEERDCGPSGRSSIMASIDCSIFGLGCVSMNYDLQREVAAGQLGFQTLRAQSWVASLLPPFVAGSLAVSP